MADTTQLTSITADQANQIDFNLQQVPSAMGIDIPPEAAAAMLHLSTAQWQAHVASAAADCVRKAQALLTNAKHRTDIQRLKTLHRAENPVSTVMTVGDSITTYRYGYAEILRQMLDLVDPETPVQFFNHGRSGYTSTHGLEHTFTQYRVQRPDWVFLMYGVNDTKRFGHPEKLLVSADEYTANMTAIIDGFLEIGAHLIVLTPTPVVESILADNPVFQTWAMRWDNADIGARAATLRTLTKTRGVPLVDLFALFGSTPDPALLLPDGLHPGPAGHDRIIAQVLERVLI